MELVNVMDKAGSYAFQEHGEMIISSVRGEDVYKRQVPDLKSGILRDGDVSAPGPGGAVGPDIIEKQIGRAHV